MIYQHTRFEPLLQIINCTFSFLQKTSKSSKGTDELEQNIVSVKLKNKSKTWMLNVQPYPERSNRTHLSLPLSHLP